jgi:hypothetical protein
MIMLVSRVKCADNSLFNYSLLLALTCVGDSFLFIWNVLFMGTAGLHIANLLSTDISLVETSLEIAGHDLFTTCYASARVNMFRFSFDCFQCWSLKKMLRERKQREGIQNKDSESEPALVLPQLARVETKAYTPGMYVLTKKFKMCDRLCVYVP